jgi:hypothetical protein
LGAPNENVDVEAGFAAAGVPKENGALAGSLASEDLAGGAPNEKDGAAALVAAGFAGAPNENDAAGFEPARAAGIEG